MTAPSKMPEARRAYRQERYATTEEVRQYHRDYHAANRERINRQRRENYMKKHYGMTFDDFDRMLAEQGGCAICGIEEANWHIDHDHETGKVRGILCHGCNVGIGYMGDDPARVQRAADYLRRHHADQ